MSNNIVEFPTSSAGQVSVQAALRRFAPTSRAVAKCKRDLDTILNQVLSPKEMHDLLLPQNEAALSAARLLDTVVNGGEVIAHELILDLLKTLQSVISTQKKSEEELAAFALSGMALFDFDIDSAGADLEIWNATPRHPMVVALAVQSLIQRQTFSPSLSEMASACRSVHYRLEKAFGMVLDWLDRFNRLDASCATKTRESHDAWARNLTLEKIAAIEAIDELLCHFKRTINWYVFDTTRLQDAKPKEFPLREKFLVAIKNKLTLGDAPTLSDEEVEVIAASCGWESWRMREAREQREHEEYLEQKRLQEIREQRQREQERLWEKRRHQCAFCRKSEKAVAHLFGVGLYEPKVSAYTLMGFRPKRLGPKPVAVCNECLETNPCEGPELTCSFCGAKKPAVLDNGNDAICRDCFQSTAEEWKKWSYPMVDFIIGERGNLTEDFAEDKARKFNAFVKQIEKAAIYLKIEGYDDDYGQPLYNDEAPKVAAYVRSWARFAKLDLKRAVQLFGPETWGGNNYPETLHFLLMTDAVGEFSARFDELLLDECVAIAVKLCEGEAAGSS